MNIQELKNLLMLKSGYKNNFEVIFIIEKELTSLNINYSKLEDGTIFSLQDRSLPIFSAHMDTVRTVKDDAAISKVKIIEVEKTNGEKVEAIINKKHILGGDDICGVYILLNLLKENNKLNFIFTNNEEMPGKQTARDFVADNFIGDFPYMIVLDRKGNDDIICYLNNYGSKEFEEDLAEIGTNFGFKPNRGYFCDADFFRNQLSVANLSCGYYFPHSSKEIVVFEDVVNTFNYCKEIVKALIGKKYEINSETFSWAFERQIIDSFVKIHNSAFGRNYKETI